MHIEKSYADPFAARYHLVGDDGQRIGLAKVHHKEPGSGMIVAESYLGFRSYAHFSQGDLQRAYEAFAAKATHIQTPPEPANERELAYFNARQETAKQQYELDDDQRREVRKGVTASNKEAKAAKTLAAEVRRARKATKH